MTYGEQELAQQHRLLSPNIIGIDNRQQPFNGYGDQVASLYSGMDLRKWF